MLVKSCGPELVDQSKRLHEMGGFLGKSGVGQHFLPAYPAERCFPPVFLPSPITFSSVHATLDQQVFRGVRGQIKQLSEALPSPSIDTGRCVIGTEANETLSQQPTAITVPTTVDQNPALVLDVADGTDSTNPEKSKTGIGSSRREDSGPTVQMSPASETINSGENPDVEI